MRDLRGLSVFLLLVLAALPVVCGCGGKTASSKISWAKSFEDGMSEAADSGKPIMIDIYADWCGPCKMLSKNVFPNPEVVKLARDFVCIKLNIDKDPQNASKFQFEGVPTIIFADSNGNEVHRVVGYMPAAQFLEEMKKGK